MSRKVAIKDLSGKAVGKACGVKGGMKKKTSGLHEDCTCSCTDTGSTKSANMTKLDCL